MTKLDWTRSKKSKLDPGALIEPPEGKRGFDYIVRPSEREEAEKCEFLIHRKFLLERSEIRRMRSVLKKYGPEKARKLGVTAEKIAKTEASMSESIRRIRRAFGKLQK